MARHLLAAYRCVIHLPLGPQSSGAREVGEPGRLWRCPEPQTSPAAAWSRFHGQGQHLPSSLRGFGSEGPVWFSVSLVFACIDSHPTHSLEGVISFLSSCRGMTPEKTYRRRRSHISAETPGMGGGQAAAPDGGLTSLSSRTAPKTAHRACWIDLSVMRFWLRFPLNSSCYLTWRIQNVTWQASQEHWITQFKPCQLSDPLEIHLCLLWCAGLDCQESVRTAGPRPQLHRKPSRCWVCLGLTSSGRSLCLCGPLLAGPGGQGAEGRKRRVMGTFWGPWFRSLGGDVCLHFILLSVEYDVFMNSVCLIFINACLYF